MSMMFRRAICLLAACAIAACSNAATTLPPGAGVQGLNGNAQSIRTARHAKGTLVLHIHVPKRRHRRGAHYVSPATQSMTIAITGPTTINQTVGLTPTSTGCSSSLTGTFCTLTTPGLLPGSYTATMTMYDGTGGTGNVLSAAQAIAFTIASGVDNTIGITLSGVPVATIVTPANANTLANGYGIFDLVGSGPYTFLARTLDADGNIIAGPGAPTFTVSTPTGPLAGVTTAPSSTTTTAPNQFTVTPPSTYAAGTAQFAVTPTFSGQATDGCVQTGANCGGATVIVAMGLPFSWTQQSPATSPSARGGSTMAYDPATGQLILFGGLDSSYTLQNDTWNWTGTNWTQLTPATSPPARRNATMAYDAGTGTLVLFGGQSSSGFVSDTWTWNGTNWVQQFPAASPPARFNAAMAYDGIHGTMVLFGGDDRFGSLNDTWTWNGTNWVQQSPATSPSARGGTSMVYDAGSGTLALFGGFPNGYSTNETWTWDGTTWTQQHPAVSPPARGSASMVYEPTRGAAILFGGSNGVLQNDVWMWSRATWTQLTPASAPTVRELSAVDYDAGTNTLVLFGGYNSSVGYVNDTWYGQ